MARPDTLRRSGFALMALLPALSGAVPVLSADAATAPDYVITFTDQGVRPDVLEVPAETRIKLTLVNRTSAAVEFESLPLRKEKVLAPGASSFLVLRGLAAGDYPFFDDFHPGHPPARLVAR